MKLLIVEDDDAVATYVAQRFMDEGHEVVTANDGLVASKLADSTDFDVFIFDRMLPGMDGLTLLELLRQRGCDTPTLFITALDTLQDKLGGLAIGDDYLVKPFEFAELSARVAALARRVNKHNPDMLLVHGSVILNRVSRKVRCHDQDVEVNPVEFKLLEYLMLHQGEVVTRKMLLKDVWGYHFEPSTSIVETYISRLRAKLEPHQVDGMIKTIRGAGYTLD